LSIVVDDCAMLLRLPYLDLEILPLRHQLAILHRQRGEQRVRFDPAAWTWLAALLHQMPRLSLRRLWPDTDITVVLSGVGSS
jgi:hypothetical protein